MTSGLGHLHNQLVDNASQLKEAARLQSIKARCVQELLEGLVAPSRTTARSLLEDSSPNKWSTPSKANLSMLAKSGRKDPGGPQLPHKTFQVWRLRLFVGWQFGPAP